MQITILPASWFICEITTIGKDLENIYSSTADTAISNKQKVREIAVQSS